MKWVNKTIDDIEHGPATLQAAMDAIPDNRLICKEKFYLHSGMKTDFSLNLSSIQTALIQITGRFCEHYASDLMCTFWNLDPFLNGANRNKSDRWTIGVGIRESGVDGNTYIMSRLKRTVSGPFDYVNTKQDYRKILAIDIRDELQDDGCVIRTFRLADITGNLLRISPQDEKEGDS